MNAVSDRIYKKAASCGAVFFCTDERNVPVLFKHIHGMNCYLRTFLPF